MEARKKRNIRPGYEYDGLFPGSDNSNKTIRRNAHLDHTVAFIPKVVERTLSHTRKIAERLKGRSVYDTCRNIWEFVYSHINYKKDAEGYEQIRSPARSWHDRKTGVDCDCYSVFISSVLTNLGIPHLLRITKYNRSYFQHIYPVVKDGLTEITIDCVTDQFDYEVAYKQKKDYPMDLQYLSGFDGQGFGELGKVKRGAKVKPALLAKATKLSKKAKKKAAANAAAASGQPKPKKKGFFKKIVGVINKVNPVTVLLRNGVLAAMKLNVKNVAKRLRWSYLAPDQAAAKGIDPVKFQKLIVTRQKLEKIFSGAGGNIKNLKKAILGGKGNKDKAVSGLGMLPMQEWSGYMNEYTPLGELLGAEIYYSENIEGMQGFEGFGELGEPVTLATVGAAMGVISGIVAALKQIGDIFKKKTAGSEDFDEGKTDAPENNVSVPPADSSALPTITPSSNTSSSAVSPGLSPDVLPVTPDSTNYSLTPAERGSVTAPLPSSAGSESGASFPTVQEEADSGAAASSSSSTGSGEPKESFWEKNKKWLKPVAIGVGGLTLIAIGIKLMKSNKPPAKQSSHGRSLSGVTHKKRKKKKGKTKQRRRNRVHPVALL